jgi:hypothetical protein
MSMLLGRTFIQYTNKLKPKYNVKYLNTNQSKNMNIYHQKIERYINKIDVCFIFFICPN